MEIVIVFAAPPLLLTPTTCFLFLIFGWRKLRGLFGHGKSDDLQGWRFRCRYWVLRVDESSSNFRVAFAVTVGTFARVLRPVLFGFLHAGNFAY